MLSVFPEILFLAPFAALALRLALAILFALGAWQHFSAQDISIRVFSALEFGIAAALFAGAWTQPVALVGLAVALVGLVFVPRIRAYPLSTMLLACVMLASLVVMGAGAFAFDLPL
jgi:uncharacterized membrane protein YphA (DoxX/SURF4 family)